MRQAAILAALIAATSAAIAGAPETSLRPVARPDTPIVAPVPDILAQSVAARFSVTRPVARPAGLARTAPLAVTSAPEPEPDQTDPQQSVSSPNRETARPSGRDQADDERKRIAQPSGEGSRGGVMASLRPLLRPLVIGREATKRKEERARGMVCGDKAILGEVIGRVPGRIAGCGIDSAVKVRSISGVALSQHSLMDCGQARATKSWIDKGMKPAVGGYGGGVAQLRVVAHYACRTRNNQRGGKVSEHGKGRAIDIAGFQLRDGRTITVLTDWGGGRKGRILRQMHRSACGPFGTVLGPDANKFHRDHFHFDTARYRSGSYCR